MESTCCACGMKYEFQENKETIPHTEIKNLLRFCIPEIFHKSSITEDDNFLITMCSRCTLILNSYKEFKQKCMKWFETFGPTSETLTAIDTANNNNKEFNTDHGEDLFLVHVEAIKYNASITTNSTQRTPNINQCDICNRTYSTKYHLEAHKKLHTDLRPHICSFCGKAFKTTTDCRNHEKIHTNLRNYKCNEPGCTKGFNTLTERQKHKLIVHTDSSLWRFECDYCRRKFAIKSHLDRHVKIHTGDKQFKCHICLYTCIERHHLMKHIKMHNFVDTFKCSMCPMEYKHEKSLKLHVNKKHSGREPSNVIEKEVEKNLICQFCGKRYARNAKLRVHIANNHAD